MADRGDVPGSQRATDVPTSGAPLRAWPFPFAGVVTVADDIDVSRWTADHAVKSELRDRFGLDWGRSMHVYAPASEREGHVALTNQTGDAASDAIINGAGFHNPTYHLARSFHRGEIDYIHMWSDFGAGRWLPEPIDHPSRVGAVSVLGQRRLAASAGPSGTGESDAVPVLRPEPAHFPGLRFYLETDRGVRAVELLVEDRRGRRFAFCFGDARSEDCTWRDALPAPGERELQAYFFESDAAPDAKRRGSPLDFKWRSMQLLVAGESGAGARVEEVLYSAFNRNLVARQLPLLRRFDIGFLSYSDHGGADNGVNLLRRADDGASPQRPPNDPWMYDDELTGVRVDNHAEGDRPGSDYYFSDLLTDSGHVFFLFGNDLANNYRALNEVRPYALDELLVPYELAGGERVYNVRRYHPGIWRDGDPGERYSITWNSRFGQVIDDVLARFDTPGVPPEENVFGPIVTHLAFEGDAVRLGTNPHRIEPGDAFNSETDAALERLAQRVYDFDGRVPDAARLWTPTMTRLYRYAQVMHGLEQRNVEAAADSIDVSSWEDDVTGERLPDPAAPDRDLHGVTFYVRNSAAAQVRVDGRPIHSVVRNPADRTGRESVTVVNASTPRIVFDEVWPRVGDEQAVGSIVATASETAPSGRNVLRFDAHGSRRSLRLAAAPPAGAANNGDASHLSFFARTADRGALLRVAYRLEDGRRFVARVANRPAWPVRGWTSTWDDSGGWRQYVFPFHDAPFRKGAANRPPRGAIAAIEIEALTDAVVEIDRLAFLRDAPFPKVRTGNLVSGRLSSEQDGVRVRLHGNSGEVEETRTVDGGYYVFQEVPSGAVVRIEVVDEQGSVWFGGGGAVEVGSNLLELDVALPRWPLGRTATLAATKGRIAWTGGLVPRNRVPGQRPLPLAPSRFGPFRTYEPDRLVSWWGTGTPQEYDTYQYANNLGFLDRDRDVAASRRDDDAFNVLLFGDCLFSGAQFGQHAKLSILLERSLAPIVGHPVEAPLLSLTTLAPYHFSLLYDAVGRTFAPKLALVSVMMSTFRNASASLRAEDMGLEVGAYPDAMLDLRDGQFFVRPPDPKFFRKPKQWTRDWSGGSSHRFSTYVEPADWMREELEHATVVLTESLRRLRDRLREDGATMVLVLAQDRYALDRPRQGTDGSYRYDADLADRRMAAIAEALGVNYLNLVAELEKRADHLRAQWVFDPHWTARGHAMTAEILVEYLREHDLLPERDAGSVP